MKRYRLFNDDIDYSINANNETSHSQETKWFLKNEVACTKISDFTRWSKNSCVLLWRVIEHAILINLSLDVKYTLITNMANIVAEKSWNLPLLFFYRVTRKVWPAREQRGGLVVPNLKRKYLVTYLVIQSFSQTPHHTRWNGFLLKRLS